jgi:hypothetical protein
MSDEKLLESLNTIFVKHRESLVAGTAPYQFSQIQDELSGELSDIEFLDKPTNRTLLYFVHGMLRAFDNAKTKDDTIQLLQEILDAIMLASKSLYS